MELWVSPTASMTLSESPVSPCLSCLSKMLKMFCENPICLSGLQKEAGESWDPMHGFSSKEEQHSTNDARLEPLSAAPAKKGAHWDNKTHPHLVMPIPSELNSSHVLDSVMTSIYPSDLEAGEWVRKQGTGSEPKISGRGPSSFTHGRNPFFSRTPRAPWQQNLWVLKPQNLSFSATNHLVSAVKLGSWKKDSFTGPLIFPSVQGMKHHLFLPVIHRNSMRMKEITGNYAYVTVLCLVWWIDTRAASLIQTDEFGRLCGKFEVDNGFSVDYWNDPSVSSHDQGWACRKRKSWALHSRPSFPYLLCMHALKMF